MNYDIQTLQLVFGSKTVIANPQATINKLLTDSRTLGDNSKALFFALQKQRDGHRYLADAYQNGVKNFVISKPINFAAFSAANFFLVNDTTEALQRLAAYHRAKFNLPIIGITGSNGKTIVKEWLFQLLANDYHITKSPKSFNSQIGVPLSVWQINQRHDLGIFEAGISTTDEMIKLQNIIKPSIGVLTNIGQAHAEGFTATHQKLNEKLNLFREVGLMIYAPDYVLGKTKKDIPGKRQFTWSFCQSADLEILQVEKFNNYSILHAKWQNDTLSAQVFFTDKASLENVVICWATLLAMGVKMRDAADRLSRLSPISMRLRLANGIENCSVIDDSYSADLSSLVIALDFLHQQNQYIQKTVILSDIYESGKSDEELYADIAHLLKEKKVDRLIGIGKKISTQASKFNLTSQFFENTADFLKWFSPTHFGKEIILIKGARRFCFEQISKLLIQKIHDTVLEINLNALAANVQFYRSKLNPNVKLMTMVKAFSYGNGSFEIANLLQFHKVDYLAVAYADEGIALRKAGIKLPIMVMSPEPSAFEALMQHKLEPEIYHIDILKSFVRYAGKHSQTNPIHLKIDTGMHRLGFMPNEIPQLLTFLAEHQNLKIASVFSHLVAGDNAMHDGFSQQQLLIFEQIYAQITSVLGYKPIRHISNTAAISRLPQAQLDMVRLGIGMYGFDSALHNHELQTVATLKTTVTQIKHLPKNETVGYNRKGILPEGGKIATVKIGYADGYSRSFGNGAGKMLINGKMAPTIGSICMDMTMLNVSHIEVQPGDEVIVFGSEPSIATLAKQINTIAYEILTKISQRVKRVYFYE